MQVMVADGSRMLLVAAGGAYFEVRQKVDLVSSIESSFERVDGDYACLNPRPHGAGRTLRDILTFLLTATDF